MRARSRLIPAAILLASCLAGAQRPETARTNIPLVDAKPVLDAIRSDLLPPEFQDRSEAEIAQAWDGWVGARDAHIRRRLDGGDDDSVINLLLFGTSFTRQRRANAREILTLAREGRLGDFMQGPLVQRRIQDLVASAAAPGESERLQFVNRVMGRATIDPQRYLETGLRRVLAEYDAYARAPAPEQSVRFDDRGLSSDTSIYPGFAIEQALEAVASARLAGAGTVRRVAIVGPGLDFTDKREGFDFYPQQTLQPFAVVDSLIRLGLANGADVGVTTFDLSQRVNEHLETGLRRARTGGAYLLHLPRDTTASWNPDLAAYWDRFGDRIGEQVPPMTTPSGVGTVDVRAVRIPPARVLGITPYDLNIVLQRLGFLGSDEQFDLVVATNLLVYYDVFERSLAFANVAHMLRSGGLFLANNSTPVVLPASLDAIGSSETTFSSLLNDHDRIQ